ncbi:MAG: DUF3786 domain-containing protein [Clostridiales bacterium]|nr:DUF3786 domain-containing protein [Clostridiales bacterium]
MQSTQTTDNYALVCAQWQERFLSLDLQKLLQKLPGLQDQGEMLTIDLFHRTYGIRKATGEILSLDSQTPISLFTKLNIYTLIWYCREQPSFADDWVPFRDLKNASPYGPAYQRTVINTFTRTFSGHTEALIFACEKLGGQRLDHGDVGYQLPTFLCIPMRIFFWDGDEEFPAQANFLFDRNCVDYIHVESIVTIASECVTRLAEEAGLKCSCAVT